MHDCERMEGQAGRCRLANAEAAGGWRVHTATDTAGGGAAVGPQRCSFICPGGWPAEAF